MDVDKRKLRITDRSGADLKVWGDDDQRPACLIPAPGTDEACVLKVEGQCPEGCRACVDFAEEMSQAQPTEEQTMELCDYCQIECDLWEPGEPGQCLAVDPGDCPGNGPEDIEAIKDWQRRQVEECPAQAPRGLADRQGRGSSDL